MVKFIFRVLAFLAFAAYILLIAMIVFKGDLNDYDGGMNWTLFSTIRRYPVSSVDFWLNIVGNVVMFLPFGFFVGYFSGRGFFGWFVALILIVGVPVGIEFAQKEIGRVFDVDDILLNSAGGILGYIFQKIFRPQRQ